MGTVAQPLLGTMFAGSLVDQCEAVLISAQGADIVYRFSGTVPGTGVGHVVASGTSVFLRGNNLIRNLSFISKTSSAAAINLTIMGD